MEDLNRVSLGFEMIGRSERRNPIPEAEAMAEGVRAVQSVRRN